MPAFYVGCTVCPTQYPYIAGKRFCSKVCRQAAFDQKHSKEDEGMNLLPVLVVSDEELERFADQPADAPCRYVIQANARHSHRVTDAAGGMPGPEGAVGWAGGLLAASRVTGQCVTE